VDPIKATAVLAGLTVAMACAPAGADLLAFDDFESYTPGVTLNNGAGGSGWAGNWATDALEVTVEDGAIPGFGLSVQIDTLGQTDSIMRRAPAAQTETVYIGFVLRTTGGWDSSDFLQFYGNDSTGPSNEDSVSGGIRNHDPSPYFARVGRWPDSANSTTTFHGDDRTYAVVLRFGRTPGETEYDQSAIFIDQATEATAAASKMLAGASDTTTISQFHVRTFDIDEGQLIYIDQLKIATTYAEAYTPVPAPVSSALVGIGGAWLAGRRNSTRGSGG
jgi:hypothetical protein